MKKLQADVVVIGGGSTGVGVVRDVAMRGYSTILVERADLGQGTTSRFHGLLHSGGRYVVSDPISARECAEENAILRKIQAHAVEPTGGFFVSLKGDDPEFPDKFVAGAAEANMPCQEISPEEALRREPRLNPNLNRVFEVEDGSVDGWQLVWTAARSAEMYGAKILTYTKVTGLEKEGDRVSAVIAEDRKTGETISIETDFVLNCAGPWAGQIADMAGCHPVEVIPGRGIMIAMNHRLVNTVINRCITPADGDILVPAHTVSIIGTTDVKVDDPDKLEIPENEVQQMLDAGEELVPGFRHARAVHAWVGARPLIKDDRVDSSDTRHMSRGMAVLDHEQRDGIKGLMTIGGGKLTTYRLMAEHIVDAMERVTGNQHPCRTAEEPVPGSEDKRLYSVRHRLEHREENWQADQVLCECEQISTSDLEREIQEGPENPSMDDLRRRLRIGMGPCQGGICANRFAGAICNKGYADADGATALLQRFLRNRWIGLWPLIYGQQVRQTALDYWMTSGTLDVNHLPAPEKVVL